MKYTFVQRFDAIRHPEQEEAIDIAMHNAAKEFGRMMLGKAKVEVDTDIDNGLFYQTVRIVAEV